MSRAAKAAGRAARLAAVAIALPACALAGIEAAQAASSLSFSNDVLPWVLLVGGVVWLAGSALELKSAGTMSHPGTAALSVVGIVAGLLAVLGHHGFLDLFVRVYGWFDFLQTFVGAVLSLVLLPLMLIALCFFAVLWAWDSNVPFRLNDRVLTGRVATVLGFGVLVFMALFCSLFLYFAWDFLRDLFG